MKEEDIKKKYHDEIKELDELNEQLAKYYEEYHNYSENLNDTMAKIEGELPHLENEPNFKYRMIELYHQVRDITKQLDVFYKEMLTNRTLVNIINVNMKILFDTIEEIEKLKVLKEQFKEVGELKKDFEQINEDMHFVKELKEIIDESQKEKKQQGNVDYVG